MVTLQFGLPPPGAANAYIFNRWEFRMGSHTISLHLNTHTTILFGKPNDLEFKDPWLRLDCYLEVFVSQRILTGCGYK